MSYSTFTDHYMIVAGCDLALSPVSEVKISAVGILGLQAYHFDKRRFTVHVRRPTAVVFAYDRVVMDFPHLFGFLRVFPVDHFEGSDKAAVASHVTRRTSHDDSQSTARPVSYYPVKWSCLPT